MKHRTGLRLRPWVTALLCRIIGQIWYFQDDIFAQQVLAATFEIYLFYMYSIFKVL